MNTASPLPTTDEPDNDPHLWLEEIEGEAPLTWVESQNARTLARFGGPEFASDRDTLAAILDRPDKIPYIARRGGLVYNFWRDADHPRGLWRRTSLSEFRSEAPSWETLLDIDALAAAEGEDWVWHGAAALPPAHERAILKLSRGGSDAVQLREFDLARKCFVEDGFNLPEAKSWPGWLDPDTLLLSTALGGGEGVTRSGYARRVRLWRRGTDALTAPVLLEVAKDCMSASASLDRTAKSERIRFTKSIGFFERERWIGGRDGPQTKLDLPADAIWVEIYGDWFVLKLRSPWTVNGATYAPDTVLGGFLPALLEGKPALEVLFEGGERVTAPDCFWLRGKLFLSILDNLKPRYEVYTPSPSGWTHEPLANLPDAGIVSVWPMDQEDDELNGELILNFQGPITPPTLALLDGSPAPAVLKRAPSDFDASGLVISRHEAISIDGERIPYTQVGPAGETGNAPVLMNGYGGFDVSVLPYYSSARGKLWLERGGTCVITNIRGGGEFGTRWHEAGRRAGKRLSHDDFAAIAADLVRRGVTVPKRIAAEGGSNGGILITNMLTRYPERFGALFCTIPLIDMRRYSKLLAGASWIDEYGDPDKPEDWAFLQTYSAYHNAKPGQDYPPILLATTQRDDRVHPGHARKMAAKLQAMGYEAYFYEPAAGGHGYGKDAKEQAAFIALGYNFLRDAIGWR